MEAVSRLTGTGVPMWRDNVDTDQIIPAHWMKRVSRTGYEDGLFELLRGDPSFVLNQPQYAGATILLAGDNFGCGSSREHAPWALRDYGFRAVVAVSMADIFRGNLANTGLVPAQVTRDDLAPFVELVTADPSAHLELDLQDCTLTGPDGLRAPFQIDTQARERLLAGQDLIGATLSHEQDIAAYERKRPASRPRNASTAAKPA